MWMFDYFVKELGIQIISEELILERNGMKFYLHHGDGLGPGDAKYKILKKIFRSEFCQWLFARIHPNLGLAIARKWSKHSRLQNNQKEEFQDLEKEWLVSYSKELLLKEHYDFLIFGHRHLPLDVQLGDSRYINLGEWMNFNSYAVFDGENLELRYFKKQE
jgi:UDP-2,3-diacylglucosamine hydrolase